MIQLKVRRFGRSLGVALPHEVIHRLQVGGGDRLFLIEAPDGDYRLTSYDPAFGKRMKKAEEVMSRYRNTLRNLAE
ncbi:MAG: AbrB/MazE/SpoVT family DNA-binding domain-containing protein [Terriglobales bacterium]|jgi:putative addiction module antidote